jgi:leucyl aminopeptidase (aminopeptidase T)
MVLAVGTEPRGEYLLLELAAAARKLVEVAMPVRSGEQVVITADTSSDERVVRATAQAAYVMGATPTVIWYQTLPNPCQDPPPPVARALTAADVWIEYAVTYTLYSSAHREAIAAGCRYFCLPGMDVDMMVRTIGKVNYRLLEEVGSALYELSHEAEEIHITSPAGTDLRVHTDPDAPPAFTQMGAGEGRGYSQMLAGQSWFQELADTFHGTLVFDGAIWPPAELGLLKNPVRLTVEEGHVVRIDGGAEARVFRRWLEGFHDPSMLLVDHSCYGFNPGVTRLTGRILEDERLFGCMQFGIGRTRMGAPSHTDGIVTNPSVWAGEVCLEDEGVYVHPRVVELCRSMGVSGY